MRFTPLQIPTLALAFLPFVIAYNGHGIFGALFWMILWIILKLAIVFVHNSKRLDNKKVILNTLPISHYVEKVRWCLDKTGMEYEEEKDIGIFWILTTGRPVPTLNIPGKMISIANSSDILRYLYGHLKACNPEKAEFLEPQNLEMEEKMDKMAHQLRTFLYYHILVGNKNSDEMALKTWGIYENGIPPWQKSILKLLAPILKKCLIHLLKVNKQHAEENMKKAEEFLEEMDKILGKNKFILGTEEPTYLDFAFASLAGIYALPDQYGGPGLTPESRIKMSDFTLEMQKNIKKFRNTNSGKFVLKMYAEHRF